MQQILNFKIEIYDVRMRTSISIIDDTALVRNIQINKSTTLDNTATISFSKSKTYGTIGVETILKLFNYVKIELTVKNYNPNSEEKLYFSGFIQTINKNANFGVNPTATVNITIADYATLLKTTFYTKNLTFLEILNQAVPEFRLINLTEYLGDSSQKLLNGFYTPTQLGFIFFAFLYFKFMYKLIYDDDGSAKKTSPPNSKEIFKKFKIYTPFGFDLPPPSGDTFLKGQEQTITIYKQLQGVALDLFKYIYPEPIFEFSTYETEDSVILMIRLTPLMKFDRALNSPVEMQVGEQDEGMPGIYMTKNVSTQGFAFDPSSYNVIEKLDFGHKRIKSIRERFGVSPSHMLKSHIDEQPSNLLTNLKNTIGKSKNLNIEDLIANDEEADEITDKFFNVIWINSDYIETLNMTRSASSVVNVIWTVPTTDTAVLKMSGRELVYAYLEQRLNEAGGPDQFGNYIYQQFNDGVYANPVFLMDYRGVYGQQFVSGDMNYFGFREFEVKWNYLSIEYNTASAILSRVDRNVLIEAKSASKNKTVTKMIDDAMAATGSALTQSSTAKKNPRRDKANPIFPVSSLVEKYISPNPLAGGPLAEYTQINFRQTSRAGNLPKPSKNKKSAINVAISDKEFNDAMIRYGLNQNDLKNADTIIKLLKRAKREDEELMGGFVSKLNSVIAEAYRENEHLYDCVIGRPINLSILPGMIVESTSPSQKGKSPFIKGYVTSVSHVIDFNASSMKSNINISRAASDDSGVIEKVGP